VALANQSPSLSVLNLFRIPELRNRLGITALLLLVYRIGYHIPLPGIDLSNIERVRNMQDTKAKLFGMMSQLTGSSILQFDLFSLGVMPYISASIILSLLVKVVPALDALSKEGQVGQKKINQYTRYLTVPICLIQATFVYTGVIASNYGNYNLLPEGPGIWSLLLIVLSLTAGSIFVMWLGEQITEHGVGNGTSIIIMAGIVSRLPYSIIAFFENYDIARAVSSVMEVLAIWVVIVVAIVYVTKGQRRIPIQQGKLVKGGKIYGGQKHFLPFRLNQAGVMPIIFASALFLIPTFIGEVTGWKKIAEVFYRSDGFIYITTYTLLIFFFSFFWTTLMFQPNEIATQLKEHGSFIPGIRPGKKTAEFLEGVVVRITLAGAAFLTVIAIIPGFVRTEFAYDAQVAAFLGGTSVLIVVSVALDLVDKLNAQLVMRNYKGFLTGGALGPAAAVRRG
jgi:preprotein translocase subunit SecY